MSDPALEDLAVEADRGDLLPASRRTRSPWCCWAHPRSSSSRSGACRRRSPRGAGVAPASMTCTSTRSPTNARSAASASSKVIGAALSPKKGVDTRDRAGSEEPTKTPHEALEREPESAARGDQVVSSGRAPSPRGSEGLAVIGRDCAVALIAGEPGASAGGIAPPGLRAAAEVAGHGGTVADRTYVRITFWLDTQMGRWDSRVVKPGFPRGMADRLWRPLLGFVGAVAVFLCVGVPAQAHRFVYVANEVWPATAMSPSTRFAPGACSRRSARRPSPRA